MTSSSWIQPLQSVDLGSVNTPNGLSKYVDGKLITPYVFKLQDTFLNANGTSLYYKGTDSGSEPHWDFDADLTESTPEVQNNRVVFGTSPQAIRIDIPRQLESRIYLDAYLQPTDPTSFLHVFIGRSLSQPAPYARIQFTQSDLAVYVVNPLGGESLAFTVSYLTLDIITAPLTLQITCTKSLTQGYFVIKILTAFGYNILHQYAVDEVFNIHQDGISLLGKGPDWSVSRLYVEERLPQPINPDALTESNYLAAIGLATQTDPGLMSTVDKVALDIEGAKTVRLIATDFIDIDNITLVDGVNPNEGDLIILNSQFHIDNGFSGVYIYHETDPFEAALEYTENYRLIRVTDGDLNSGYWVKNKNPFGGYNRFITDDLLEASLESLNLVDSTVANYFSLYGTTSTPRRKAAVNDFVSQLKEYEIWNLLHTVWVNSGDTEANIGRVLKGTTGTISRTLNFAPSTSLTPGELKATGGFMTIDSTTEMSFGAPVALDSNYSIGYAIYAASEETFYKNILALGTQTQGIQLAPSSAFNHFPSAFFVADGNDAIGPQELGGFYVTRSGNDFFPYRNGRAGLPVTFSPIPLTVDGRFTSTTNQGGDGVAAAVYGQALSKGKASKLSQLLDELARKF